VHWPSTSVHLTGLCTIEALQLATELPPLLSRIAWAPVPQMHVRVSLVSAQTFPPAVDASLGTGPSKGLEL